MASVSTYTLLSLREAPKRSFCTCHSGRREATSRHVQTQGRRGLPHDLLRPRLHTSPVRLEWGGAPPASFEVLELWFKAFVSWR